MARIPADGHKIVTTARNPSDTGRVLALASANPKLPIVLTAISGTIPHKKKILRDLDVIDPAARRIGAVNTVWRKAGKWRGANTDAAGVTQPLERRVRLCKSSVLVVGNGGAARGAAFGL